jgi:hypothetical protein
MGKRQRVEGGKMDGDFLPPVVKTGIGLQGEKWVKMG